MDTLLFENSYRFKQKKQQADYKRTAESSRSICQEAILLACNKSLLEYHQMFFPMRGDTSDGIGQIKEMENQIKSLSNTKISKFEKAKKIQHMLNQLEFICTQFKYTD